MSSIDNYAYKKPSTLQRPQTLQRTKSSVVKSNFNNATQFRSLKIDCNTSNNHLTRKPSFRQKIFSIFKNYSKMSHQNSPIDSFTNDENNGKYISNHENPGFEQRISSTGSKKFVHKTKPVDTQENHIKRLDSRDIVLIDKFYVHPLNAQIIKYITEFHCTSIKLPSSWISKMGTHLSNSVIMPFISTIPGLLGIENHGNTCYVNVIIQCLAHIDSVSEYFSTKDYLQHVKLDQSPSSSESASSFDVMVGFSYLLQSLWQSTYQSKISMKFCQLLTMHKREFSLDSQQDAHELLLFILNLLHDNLMQQRMPTDGGQPGPEYSDRCSAKSSLDKDGHPVEETSFIYDRFRGWLANEIVCPDCHYTRKTLDQILSLNLQIPRALAKGASPAAATGSPGSSIDHRTVCYIVVINANQVAEKHALEIDSATTIGDVRKQIAVRLGCTKVDVVVMELVRSGFGTLYSDNDDMMTIYKRTKNFESDTVDHFANGIYATCIPNQVVDVDALPLYNSFDNDMIHQTRTLKPFPDNQPFIRILVIHVEKTKECLNEISDELRRIIQSDDTDSRESNNEQSMFNDIYYRRFTNILTVQAARKTKISLLRHSLSEQMFKYLNLRNITKVPKPQFVIGGSHLVSELDVFPLTHASVNKDLQNSIDLCGEGSAHIRLVVVWPFGTTDTLKMYKRRMREHIFENRFMSLSPHRISNHPSVEELASNFDKESLTLEYDNNKPQNKINITDCLREFFSLDTLAITESWKCPNCQTSQPARTEIRIEDAPEILVLMLKRFSRQQNKSTEDLLEKRYQSRNEQIRNHTPAQAFVMDDYKSKNGMFTKTYSVRSRDGLNKLEGLVNYPLKDLDLKPYMENAADDNTYLYDLVGVVNHRGSLFNGHYVAICHNSIDNKWRLYDDDRVTEIPAPEVVQPDAYILFYKRQILPQSTNSKENLHWSYRRLTFPEKLHRNHSPSPTSVYSRHQRYSTKESTKSPDSYSTLPLSITNNHSSKYSLRSFEMPILSPHIATSDISLISSNRGSTIESDDINGIIDITKIQSEIIDVDSLSLDSSMITDVSLLKTTSSNDSGTKSLNEDSGTVLSQDFSCSIERKHLYCSVDNNSKDECYNSLSTSPSASSPSTSHTY